MYKSEWKKFEYIHRKSDVYKVFQDLCTDIFKVNHGVSILKSAHNFPYIEAYPVSSNLYKGKQVGFQCKYNEQDINKSKYTYFKNQIDKIIDWLHDDMKCDVIQYFLYYKMTAHPKWFDKLQEYANNKGIEVQFILRDELYQMLEDNDEIYLKYFYGEEINEKPIQESVSLINNYIPRSYTISKLVHNSVNIVTYSSFCDITSKLKEDEIIMLYGQAGSGKSVEINRICQSYNEKGYNTKIIKQNIYCGQKIESFIDQDFRHGNKHCLLLFDAIDETPSNVLETFINQLKIFHSNHRSIQIILGMRDTFKSTLEKYFGEIGKLDVFLNKISIIDAIEYIKARTLADNNALIEYLIELSKKDFELNPFYLSHIVNIFINTGNLIEYKNLMQVLYDIQIEIDLSKGHIYSSEDTLLLEKTTFELIGMNNQGFVINRSGNLQKLMSFGWITYNSQTRMYYYIHNNYREFLAAKYLARMDSNTIFKVISKTIHNRSFVMPQYYNISVHLFNMVINQSFKAEFIKNGKNVLIEMNPNEFDIESRIEIFNGIIQEALEKNFFLDFWKYSPENLANLIDNVQGEKHLLDLFVKYRGKHAWMNLLYVLTFSKRNQKGNSKLKQILINDILKSQDKSLIQHVLEAICKFELNDQEESHIIEMAEKANSSGCRKALYNYIFQSNKCDQYIDILLKGIKLDFMSASWKDDDDDDIYDAGEGVNLTKCLTHLTKEESVIKLIGFFTDGQRRSPLSDYQAVIYQLLNQFSKLSDKLRSALFDYIDFIISEGEKVEYNHLQKVILKFNMSNDFVQRLDEVENKFNTAREFIVSTINNENIVKYIAWIFEHNKQLNELWKSNLTHEISEMLGESHLITKEIKRYLPFKISTQNREELLHERRQVYFNKVSRYEEFKSEIKKIFNYFDNKSFSKNELIRIRENNVIEDTIILFLFSKDTYELEDLDWLTNKHNHVSLLLYMLYHTKAKLIDETQINYLRDFLLSLKEELPEKGCEQRKDGLSYNVWLNSIVFLINEYNFDFDDDIYAKLVSFEGFNSKKREYFGIEYLEDKMSIIEILDGTVSLINDGYFKNEMILLKRIEYCTKHQDNRIVEFVLNYFKNSNIDNDNLILVLYRYLVKMNRNDKLADIINDINNHTFEIIAKEFPIDSFTEALLSKELMSKDEERVKIAAYILLKHNNEDGILKYIDICMKDGKIYSNSEYSFENVKYISCLESLLVLLEIALKEEKSFHESKDEMLVSIQNYFVELSKLNDINVYELAIQKFETTVLNYDIKDPSAYLFYIEKYIDIFIETNE